MFVLMELGFWDPAPVSLAQAYYVVCVGRQGWPAAAEMTLPLGQLQGLGTLPMVSASLYPQSWVYLRAPPGNDPERGCSKELHRRDPHTEGVCWLHMGFNCPVCVWGVE